jgi:hypothetical protein
MGDGVRRASGESEVRRLRGRGQPRGRSSSCWFPDPSTAPGRRGEPNVARLGASAVLAPGVVES